MATNETIEVAHLVELDWDGRPWGAGVRAECSCGWSGDWRTDVAAAADDGTEHREIAVGPGDEMDALMSGLLDLQDNLADTVMWLAENWSAELPVPSSSGTGNPAGVRLYAYCVDADALTRAAAVLGAPLVDDAAPDSYGTRYRRAVRQFGRVALEVYQAIAAVCDECGTALADEQCPVCGQRADARPAPRHVGGLHRPSRPHLRGDGVPGRVPAAGPSGARVRASGPPGPDRACPVDPRVA